MTRDEYLAMLATEPATGTQVGAIVGEFDRLGVVDRAERLAISAELLGLENLGSTKDLVMGDAGRLVGILRRTRERVELPEITAAAVNDDQGDEHGTGNAAASGEPVTLADALGQLALMLWQLFGPGAGSAKSGDIPPASKESVSDD